MEIQELKEKVKKIAEKEKNITAVFLFGSSVEGFSNEKSDLDFGIVIGDGKVKVDLQEQLGLGVVFSDVLKKKVDVVLLNNAPLSFTYGVFSKGVSLFERNRIQTSGFIEYIMDMYLDFLPRIKKYEEEFDKGLRKEYGGSKP